MAETNQASRPAIYYWRWVVVLVAGGILGFWLAFTPEGVFGKADAVGYAVCHRIDARSFQLGERQFPLCARCTGQYLGAISGLVFQAIIGKRRAGSPPKRVIALLMLLAVVYAIDGLNSYFYLPPLLDRIPSWLHLYEPNNIIRLLTGTGMGLVIAAALFPAFASTIYRQIDQRPALPNLGAFFGMSAVALSIAGLVLTEIGWVLYLLALISSAGVLLLLGMVYTMIILMLFRIENRYEHLSQAAFPILSGLMVAILQIAIFDLGRYILTGTWGELPFG